MIGLKRGAVALYPHEKAWETEAQATMARLRQPVSRLHRTRSKRQ